MIRHALGNALVPPVTVLSIILSLLLAGAVVIETVFSLPGMGRPIVSAIQRRDYPAIQGGLLLVATALVLLNLNLATGPGSAFAPRVDDPAVAGPGKSLRRPEEPIPHGLELRPEICTLDLDTL